VVAHLYHIAQQKLLYEIVKNQSRNTQKRPYFDLKIANFSGWGLWSQPGHWREELKNLESDKEELGNKRWEELV